MALFKCSHCGNLISDKATKCTKCGIEVTQDSISEISYSQEKMGVWGDYLCGENTTNPNDKNAWVTVFSIIIILFIIFGYPANSVWAIGTVAEEETMAEQMSVDPDDVAKKAAERLEKLKMGSDQAGGDRIDKATLHWDDLMEYDSIEGYWVLDHRAIMNNLLKKGFEQTDHNKEYLTDTSWGDYWLEEWTYTFFKDKDKKRDKLYEVSFSDSECAVSITIHDSKLLSLLSKELKSKRLSVMPDGSVDEWKEIYYEGNTIYINFCGD